MADDEIENERSAEKREATTGADIERLNAMYRLSGLDVNYAYGLSSASYQRSVMDHEHTPVENVSLALLTRYFGQQPDFLKFFLAETISPFKIYEKLHAVDNKLSARQFAIMLGRNASYAARAIKEGFELNKSTPIGRLLVIIAWEIEKHGPEAVLSRLRSLAAAEARGRGIDLLELEKTGSWGSRSESGDKKPKKRRKVTKVPLVNVQIAGQVVGKDALRILTAPRPSSSDWEQPVVGLLGLFGTAGSVLDVDIINHYHEWPVRDPQDHDHVLQYGASVEPHEIRQLAASFKFEHEVSGIRTFDLPEKDPETGKKKFRRWLDLRSMSKELGLAMSSALGVSNFNSWSMKKGAMSNAAKSMLNPAEFEKKICAVEDLLGPLDIIIFPTNAQNRTAPVYAWVRRKGCLETITGRGLGKNLDIIWDEKIDWADEPGN